MREADIFLKNYKVSWRQGHTTGVTWFRSTNPIGSVALRLDALKAIGKDHPVTVESIVCEQ